MGLINTAVSAENLDAAVDEVVADILAGAPGALAAAKMLLARVPGMSESEAFEWTAQLSADLFRGPEAREGISAFLEKRPASWIPTSTEG